jgi:hypothetical protein
MKRVIPIIILVLVAAFVAFNFYAANRAEKQVNRFVQMQVRSSPAPISVKYSNINVPPFRGHINFSNIKFKNRNRTGHFGKMQIDLGYFNFFRFYIGRPISALKHASSVDIHVREGTYTNHSTKRTFSFDSVDIHQHGNLWDAMQIYLNKKAPRHKQQINATASGLYYSDDSLGVFKSDSARFHYITQKPTGKTSPKNLIQFKRITWLPPAYFQQQYAFFMKVLNLPADSIPVKNIGCSFSALNRKHIDVKNGQIETKPFTIKFHGTIARTPADSTIRLAPINVSIVNFSKELQNLLGSLGFFNSKKTKNRQHISFQLVGPVGDIRIEQKK